MSLCALLIVLIVLLAVIYVGNRKDPVSEMDNTVQRIAESQRRSLTLTRPELDANEAFIKQYEAETGEPF